MTEEKLQEAEADIKKLKKLCEAFEDSANFDINHVTYQSWQKQLAALRDKENTLLAQQQPAAARPTTNSKSSSVVIYN